MAVPERDSRDGHPDGDPGRNPRADENAAISLVADGQRSRDLVATADEGDRALAGGRAAAGRHAEQSTIDHPAVFAAGTALDGGEVLEVLDRGRGRLCADLPDAPGG